MYGILISGTALQKKETKCYFRMLNWISEPFAEECTYLCGTPYTRPLWCSKLCMDMDTRHIYLFVLARTRSGANLCGWAVCELLIHRVGGASVG